MITIPLFLLAGGGAVMFWKLDVRLGLLICALIFGYSLAASPLASAIDAAGHGLATGIQNASAQADK